MGQPLSNRPDPYAQITNPLHTEWGKPSPTPIHHVIPAPAPVTFRRRSRWVRRFVTLLVLALMGAAIWWQRAWLGDTVQSLYDRINGEDSAQVVDHAPVRAPDSDISPAQG